MYAHIRMGEGIKMDENTSFSKFKKLAMLYIWRIQQSQAVIGIIFWSLTLTGVFYQYAQYYIDKYFKVGGMISGMVVFFFLTVLAILTVGFIFDKLKFWKEQNIVNVERSPYSLYKMTARDVHWVNHIWIPMMKSQAKTEPSLSEHVSFMERWVQKLLDDDPILRADVEMVEKWISDDSKKGWSEVAVQPEEKDGANT